MYRTVLVTKDGVSTAHHEWDQASAVRLSWDLPGETVLEVPMLPNDLAMRVTVADLRAWMLQREADVLKTLPHLQGIQA
jgi:hypothetical protein